MDFSCLQGKKVLVTGASGLIGRSLVDLLLDSQAIVIAAGRDPHKFLRYESISNFRFMPYDATGTFQPGECVDVVVHAASHAVPQMFVKQPVETLLANIIGVREILQYAVRNPCKVVYVSSSEVYGTATPRENGFTEEDCGIVDLLNPRSSYPVGKRAAEALCVAYAAEYGVDVSIVRPGHIYGPTASEKDGRVSSLWPRLAARGEDIVLKSDGAQVRSYTYVKDCSTAILSVVLRGQKGEVYNIANPSVACSIRELAETIAMCAGVKLRLELPSDSERVAFNPMNNSRLDATKLQSLGWNALYSVKDGIAETLLSLKKEIAHG